MQHETIHSPRPDVRVGSCVHAATTDGARRGVSESRRRGSAYILVLGISLIVTVVGYSALTLARLDAGALAMETQAQEAQVIAQDGVEYVLNRFSRVKWWLDYTSGVESSSIQVGNGSFTFKVVDELDGNLSNNSFEPVRLYVYARVGRAVRCLSVLLQGANPLDVLHSTLYSASGLTVAGGVLTSVGGPVTTNGTLTNNATIVGSAECLVATGSGTTSNGVTILALPKPSPSATVFNMYRSWATTIPFVNIDSGSGNLMAPVLSASVNPTGGATNPNGIYYISVPANLTLSIQVPRIKGTLVIDCGDRAFVRLDQCAMNWEPHVPSYPILLIRHATTNACNDLLYPPDQTISESYYGESLNPRGTPYNDVEDSDVDDAYPSVLNGLIHVITPALSSVKVALQGNTVLNGSVLADCAVQTRGARMTWNGAIYDTPPIGYSVGPEVQVVPGTWRWETIP